MTQSVQFVRRLWALIKTDANGVAQLCLSAAEPSPADVDAAEGVLLLAGMLKGDGMHLVLPILGAVPAIPRYDLFAGVSGTDGVAKVVFDPPFAAAPKALAVAAPSTLAGPLKAEIIKDTLTGAGCRVQVTTSALVTGAVTALAGATVTVSAVGL